MPNRLAHRPQRHRFHQVGEQRAQLLRIGESGPRAAVSFDDPFEPAAFYCCGLPQSGQKFGVRGVWWPHFEQNFMPGAAAAAGTSAGAAAVTAPDGGGSVAAAGCRAFIIWFAITIPAPSPAPMPAAPPPS